jgi:hypothetical protein
MKIRSMRRIKKRKRGRRLTYPISTEEEGSQLGHITSIAQNFVALNGLPMWPYM